MRSVALKLGILTFTTLLGWTRGANAAQQSMAGDNRQYPGATTCTRLRSICLSSQPDCNIPSGVGLKRSGREPPGWWAGRLTRPAERR